MICKSRLQCHGFNLPLLLGTGISEAPEDAELLVGSGFHFSGKDAEAPRTFLALKRFAPQAALFPCDCRSVQVAFVKEDAVFVASDNRNAAAL